MILSNYWWLLIWILVGGTLLNYVPKRHERLQGRQVERWGFLPALLLVLPYILWAGFRQSIGDTALYRKVYMSTVVDFSQIWGIWGSDTKDSGFVILTMLLKAMFGQQDVLYFLVIAIFQMLCVMFVFRKYSQDYLMCMFLFIVSTDYLSWVQNGMRQFFAVCMILVTFGAILKKKYLWVVLTILLASTIHGSALLMLPIVFMVQGKAWNWKMILLLVITACCLPFAKNFEPYINDLLQNTQYDDILTNEIWQEDNGTNILRALVYSAPAIMSLFCLRALRQTKDPAVHICVNCSIVTAALYALSVVTSGIYIGRLPIYTTLQGYMALPWLIDSLFERRSAGLVRRLIYAAYIVFFYYQMHVTWSLL